MAKRKKSTLTTVIIMMLVGAAIIFAYRNVLKKSSDEKVQSQNTLTVLENLLSRDMDKKYPVTAREVLKLYARIMVALYGGEGEITDEQIEGLVDMVRKMYSAELLEANSRSKQIEDAMNEIYMFRENDIAINGYQVEKAKNAITWPDGEKEYYRLLVLLNVKEKGFNAALCKQFILVKEGMVWKIVGWTNEDVASFDK